jgi:chromate reductase
VNGVKTSVSASLRLLAICGSLRKASYNRSALLALAELAARDYDVEVRLLHDIPMYDHDYVDEHGNPEAVQRFHAAIAAADGIIVCTPEYSHSISGVLKNALDWLHGKPSVLGAKPVAIMSVSSSPLGGCRAQYDLRKILQPSEAYVLGMPEMMIGGARRKFDERGVLTDEPTRAELVTFVAAFGEWIRLVRQPAVV